MKPEDHLYTTYYVAPEDMAEKPAKWIPPFEARVKAQKEIDKKLKHTPFEPIFNITSADTYVPPPNHPKKNKPKPSCTASLSSLAPVLDLPMQPTTPVKDETFDIFHQELTQTSATGIPIYKGDMKPTLKVPAIPQPPKEEPENINLAQDLYISDSDMDNMSLISNDSDCQITSDQIDISLNIQSDTLADELLNHTLDYIAEASLPAPANQDDIPLQSNTTNNDASPEHSQEPPKEELNILIARLTEEILGIKARLDRFSNL